MKVYNPRTAQFPHLQSYRTTYMTDIVWPRMYQVHGDRVVVVSDPWQDIGEADGMVTQLSDVALWVRVADCGNMYFYDPVVDIVGICHSWWRWTALNILQKTINTMISLWSHAKNIHVYSWPAICAECHQFTKQTAWLFDDKYYEWWLLNLRSVWKDQFAEAGLHHNHIIISDLCTMCDPKLPSYKRDGTGGRIVGVIGIG